MIRRVAGVAAATGLPARPREANGGRFGGNEVRQGGALATFGDIFIDNNRGANTGTLTPITAQ